MDYEQQRDVYDCIAIWMRRYHNDNAEIQQLNHRDRSPGTYDKHTVDRRASDDDGFSFAAEVVEGAISSLTKDQEIALLFDLGIRTVGSVPNQETRLEEALQRVWRTLISHGVLGQQVQ